MTSLETCPFCTGIEARIIDSNELAFAVEDLRPVSPLHTLVITKRHEPDWFKLSASEQFACIDLVSIQKQRIERADPTVRAFNIGINCGQDAGQTVLHCHLHLIPRRAGDVKDPRGGIRHVIPGKGYYRLDD